MNEKCIIIKNRTTPIFIIDGCEIHVGIRENKLWIQADESILIEPSAANTIKIIPSKRLK